MKKLMVAAVATLIGIAANAANCNWLIYSDWVSSDGENPLEVAVYGFDALANPIADVTAALASGDLTVLDNAVANGTVNDEGAFKFSGNGITDDGGSPASASAYAIFLDKASASDATGFFATDVITAQLTDAVMADKANFYWEEVNVTGFTDIGTPTPPVVPEPTSGLLLLLGAAGLALRRKQA